MAASSATRASRCRSVRAIADPEPSGLSRTGPRHQSLTRRARPPPPGFRLAGSSFGHAAPATPTLSGRCLPLHVLEHGPCRPAIDLEPVCLLIGAERRAREHSGLAVDLVLVEPEL